VSGRFQPFGDSALRATLDPNHASARLLEALRRHPRVVDAVVTERHAMVVFDPSAPPADLDAVLEHARAAGPSTPANRHVVRVRYDGEDLDAIARATGCGVREVASRHAAATYTVATVGFLPGFAYLCGLDPALVVSRRSSPRPRVTARSVAIAGPYTGIYPFASPGGWNLVGTAVDFVPFDPERGATLALGDEVHFVEAP
jgi:UPF0271 protein